MKILVFATTGFLLLIALSYLGIQYLKSEKEARLQELILAEDSVKTIQPLSETDSLRQIVETYKNKIVGSETQMDSLKKALSEKEQKVAEVSNKIEQTTQKQDLELQRAEKAKTMAKTFEKMEVKQIAPILRNLDDSTVMLIYKETSNRFKKNILLAVNEKRAALITKNYITKN